MRKESGCGELSCEQEAAPTQHCRGTANPCKNVNGALALPPTPALVTLPPIHGADNSLAAPCSLLSGGKKNEKKNYSCECKPADANRGPLGSQKVSQTPGMQEQLCRKVPSAPQAAPAPGCALSHASSSNRQGSSFFPANVTGCTRLCGEYAVKTRCPSAGNTLLCHPAQTQQDLSYSQL